MTMAESIAGWTSRTAIEAWLGEQARRPDDALDLAAMALALGALDRMPQRLIDHARHLDALAAAPARLAPGPDAPLPERAAALNRALFEDFGYDGDRPTYDDLDNANLSRVIERRRGLPIAISILYLHAARSCGWPADGVNFPGHFLVRLNDGAASMIVDPFERGAERGTPALRRLLKSMLGDDAELAAGHFARASNRAILLRLENNIKSRRLKERDREGALGAAERMILVAPDDPGLWHDAALLNAEIGRLQRAMACLETVTRLDRDGGLRAQVAALMHRLRAKLN